MDVGIWYVGIFKKYVFRVGFLGAGGTLLARKGETSGAGALTRPVRFSKNPSRQSLVRELCLGLGTQPIASGLQSVEYCCVKDRPSMHIPRCATHHPCTVSDAVSDTC